MEAAPGVNFSLLDNRSVVRPEAAATVRTLIVSCYADSAAIDAALGATRLLHKPFDANEMGAMVAEILKDKRLM
jgi:hypothetical protein